MRLATEKAEIKSRRMELAEQRKKEAQVRQNRFRIFLMINRLNWPMMLAS